MKRKHKGNNSILEHVDEHVQAKTTTPGSVPGQKPVSVPGKEIQLDEADMDNMLFIDMEMSRLAGQAGANRRNYLKAEKMIIAKSDVVQNKADTTLEMIKKKYKIIGQIKGMDLQKGIITLA